MPHRYGSNKEKTCSGEMYLEKTRRLNLLELVSLFFKTGKWEKEKEFTFLKCRNCGTAAVWHGLDKVS